MAYSNGILISLTQDDDVDYSYSHIELNHTQRDTSTFTVISELQNPCMYAYDHSNITYLTIIIIIPTFYSVSKCNAE